MANPLMPGILKNTLLKEGKPAGGSKTKAQEAAVYRVNLKAEQEKLLTESLLKRRTAISGEDGGAGGSKPAGMRMVTLEELRCDRQEAPSPQQPHAKPREDMLVTLASIGKLYKNK